MGEQCAERSEGTCGTVARTGCGWNARWRNGRVEGWWAAMEVVVAGEVVSGARGRVEEARKEERKWS